MPDLLSLLSELEEAIPDLRDALGGNAEYMEGEEEEGLPELPADDMPMFDEGAEEDEAPPMDLETPPPFAKKKKPFPFGK